MKTPKFHKTIRQNDILIGLQTDDCVVGTFMENEAVGTFQNFAKPLTEKQLLNILSQAYAWGYESGVSDSRESVERVLYERKTAHAPTPRIASTDDFR